MDPITAVQCASAVVTFLDFGVKLLSKGREIYNSAEGVLADHAEQDAIAKRLSVLSDGLVLTIDKTSRAKNLTPAERTLKQITIECIDAAHDFTRAIEELRVTGKYRRWKSFRQALKGLWQKDKIERKRVQLETLRQEILVQVLVIVHNSQEDLSHSLPARVDGAAKAIIDTVLAQRDELKANLDDLSQDLLLAAQLPVHQFTGFFDRQTAALDEFRNLGKQWMTENQQKLSGISQKLQEERSRRINATFRLELLKSLAFEQMFDRLDDVGAKARETFDWAISQSLDESVPWTDLHTWLRSPGDIYWIVGKAGSGKSTMMKWLAEDPRVRKLLVTWADQRQLLVLKHFFWNSGTSLQSSAAGFFRSLLHDMLLQCPSTTSAVSHVRFRSADLELGYSPPWSINELVHTTKVVLEFLSKSSAICLFIDGLDECVEDNSQRLKTLEFINQYIGESSIKVITSSRPLHDIEFELQATPDLRLEDLTANDIQTYVESELTSDKRFAQLRAKDQHFASDLAIDITKRAEGVFLWVRIVVESLLRGIRNQDTASDLLRRLQETPPELKNLIEKMLSAVEEVYRVKVLKLLKIVLEQPETPSLMTCSFLDSYNPSFSIDLPFHAISSKDIHYRLNTARTHVKAQCLGLLEVRAEHSNIAALAHLDETSKLYYGEWVEFLHSTAREYLIQSTMSLSQPQEVTDFDTNAFMVESLLAQMKLTEHINLRLLFHLLSVVIRMPRPLSERVITLLVSLNEILSLQVLPEDGFSRRFCRCYNLDGPDPLLSVAISYNIFEYVKLVISLRPGAVSCARFSPLLQFAVKRRHEDIGQLMDGPSHNRKPVFMVQAYLPSSYQYICLDDTPNLDLLCLLLSRGADPNAIVINHDTSDSNKHSVWDDYLEFLHGNGARIRAQNEQLVRVWFQSTKLLLQYGAGHRTSIFPRHWLTLKYGPPEGLIVAFGHQNSRELESISWWRCISFRNFGSHVLATTKQWTQPSTQRTISGRLVLEALVDLFVFISFAALIPTILMMAYRNIMNRKGVLTTWHIIFSYLANKVMHPMVVHYLVQLIPIILIPWYSDIFRILGIEA